MFLRPATAYACSWHQCCGSGHDNVRVMGRSLPFAFCASGKERVTKKFWKMDVHKKGYSKN